MLARLQQTITLGLLAVLIAWVGACVSRGLIAWAVAGAAVILLGHAVILGLEVLVMAHINRQDHLPAAPAHDLIRAWWGEVCSAPVVFCWRQPFRSRAWPDRLAGPPGQRGVLLVHGFVCNRGLWGPWQQRLQALDIPFAAINLEPVFGDIEAYAGTIDEAVARLQQATGLPPLIVAHSMGGLAVRSWLRGLDDEAALARIHQVITLGTPHHGTALAVLPFSANTQQMRYLGPWVRTLAAAEMPALRRRFTCVYSNCDNIVFPTSTAVLPHARAVAVEACAHVHMVDHPLPFALALQALGRDDLLSHSRH